MIVAKFGGSSVASAGQFEKVKSIVEANSDRKVIVISALGKKNSEDIKTTDLLYSLYSCLSRREDYVDVYNKICKNFMEVAEQINSGIDIVRELEILEEEFTPRISKDYIVTCGEYFTAMMMADYLGYTFVDAVDLIRFNDDGSLNREVTYEQIQNAYKKYDRMVIPGFYGAYGDKTVKAFPRGGSDITGALVAGALQADCYENWTDVSGVLIADPRIVGSPKRIDQISYEELRELSFMGASVLHEETISPVRSAGIPIRIMDTNNPQGKGTLVSQSIQEESYLIKGIAGKRGYTAFTLVRDMECSRMSVMKDILIVLEKYYIDPEQLTTDVDSVNIVIASDMITDMSGLISDLRELSHITSLTVVEDMALVSILGRNFSEIDGVAGEIFTALGSVGVNVKLISYGAKDLSIVIGVDNSDYETSVDVLYKDLVNKQK